MSTNYDYTARIEFNKQIREVENNTLEERKEGYKNYSDALENNQEWLAEKIGWLIDGSYGYGSYTIAREVVQNNRANKRAWLGVTIAALEYHCPNNYARKAWNNLSADKQASMNALIDKEIESALESIANS